MDTRTDEITAMFKMENNLNADIYQHANLSEQAKAIKTQAPDCLSFVDLLCTNNLYQDAIQILAFGLPKREAIWWAYLAARDVDAHDDKAKQALDQVKNWVYEPSEQNRLLTKQTLQDYSLDNPFSWLLMAVFWSDGSISRPDEPPVIPQPHLMHNWVAGAVNLACVQASSGDAQMQYQKAVERALNIIRGGNGAT